MSLSMFVVVPKCKIKLKCCQAVVKVWLAGNKLENYHVQTVHVLNTSAKAIYVIQLNFQES